MFIINKVLLIGLLIKVYVVTFAYCYFNNYTTITNILFYPFMFVANIFIFHKVLSLEKFTLKWTIGCYAIVYLTVNLAYNFINDFL